jgi:hypothetical protein
MVKSCLPEVVLRAGIGLIILQTKDGGVILCLLLCLTLHQNNAITIVIGIKQESGCTVGSLEWGLLIYFKDNIVGYYIISKLTLYLLKYLKYIII